jgi:type IV pilus assembly protein PilW
MSGKCTETMLLPSRQRNAGLSLIELMVALLLGVIIVLSLGQMFVNLSRNNQEMAKTNSQIESARFAMQFMRNDIVHAGFWDSYVPQFDDLSSTDTPDNDTAYGGLPGAIPEPCRPIAEWDVEAGVGADADYIPYRNQLLGISIQVYRDLTNVEIADCVNTVLYPPDGLIVDPQAETDVLVVRHAKICEPGVGYCDDDGTENHLYFQSSLCLDDIEAGNVFSLSTVTALLDRTCTGGVLAPRRKYVQSIYYVRQWANTPGDLIPTLVRSQFDLAGGALSQQPAVALVEGIERFRVELGIDDVTEPYLGVHAESPNGRPLDIADLQAAVLWDDEDNWDIPTNRGDGSPDGDFVHCPSEVGGCSLFQLLNVVVVKLYVLARSIEDTEGYVDTKIYTLGGSGDIGPFAGAQAGFKRHVFSTTVRLNNVSGRRETP